tara:strand:+ start:169 stop:678 length:510 start_codon:yes stop_codon:yes gene_type:complete
MSDQGDERKKRMKQMKRAMEGLNECKEKLKEGPQELGLEDLIAEKLDALMLLTHAVGNPLTLLVAILPKVSKRCGAAAEQALAMLFEVDMKPFYRKVTDEAIAAVIHACPKLTKLDLSDCIFITYVTAHEALKTMRFLQTLMCAATHPILCCHEQLTLEMHSQSVQNQY